MVPMVNRQINVVGDNMKFAKGQRSNDSIRSDKSEVDEVAWKGSRIGPVHKRGSVIIVPFEINETSLPGST